MFYIHQTSCISPQQTFLSVDIDHLNDVSNDRLLAKEPAYDCIPPTVLRRMGKSVRMGVGAALPLLENTKGVDGIIIGTANGGKEDCVKFLNQVREYDEGLLTPINFVQSTPNAVAAHIGLLTKNLGYNISHLHLGLAFENAMIDADMLLHDDPSKNYLLGAVDDISIFNYYFEKKSGSYKETEVSAIKLYETNSSGTFAGEASTMFIVNGDKKNALATILAIDTLHTDEEMLVKDKLHSFLSKYLPADGNIDVLLSGENGDNRLLKYYSSCEHIVGEAAAILRFKHMCGEYPTATAMAVWLCCEILNKGAIPSHMIKRKGFSKYKNVLIYNTYKGIQHSFILVQLPRSLSPS